MPFFEETSLPTFTYLDSSFVTPVLVTFVAQRPQTFEVTKKVMRKRNQTTSGRVETLTFWNLDKIELGWTYSKDLRFVIHMWEQTRDGKAFTFRRHQAFTGPYPGASNPVHKNIYIVKWADGFDEIVASLSDGTKDCYDFKIRLEEVI